MLGSKVILFCTGPDCPTATSAYLTTTQGGQAAGVQRGNDSLILEPEGVEED
jgi:hypothetical protein